MIEAKAAVLEGEALEGMARGIARLAASIETYFSDPQVAAAFEAWKAQRSAEGREMEVQAG